MVKLWNIDKFFYKTEKERWKNLYGHGWMEIKYFYGSFTPPS